MGGYKEDGESIFKMRHMEMSKGNEYKLHPQKFQLDTREIFLTRTTNHWNNLPKKVVDFQTLDTFKISLDRMLDHLVWMMLLPRKTGPENSSGPFQPSIP